MVCLCLCRLTDISRFLASPYLSLRALEYVLFCCFLTPHSAYGGPMKQASEDPQHQIYKIYDLKKIECI